MFIVPVDVVPGVNEVTSVPHRVIGEIRGSILLMFGTIGLVLLLLGWIIQTGLLAGVLAVYGIVISVLGFGTWGSIALARKYL